MKNKILENYLQKLNLEQRTAATINKNKSSLILSVAGSGKTSTLTSRIAYLVSEENINPESILAVTFTNKAAAEMKSRLKTFSIESLPTWIGTFHSICNRILRSHFDKVGLNKNFHIIDSQEQESLVKKIIKNEFDNSLDVNSVLNQINNWQEKGIRANNIQEKSMSKEVFIKYEEQCLLNNCVDFGQLISRVYEILTLNENILKSYVSKFKFILVDEFQDTNNLQYKWLTLLGNVDKKIVNDFLDEQNNTIFAVGDDDQSLYSWRGANVENMNTFIKDFNPEIIKLEKNYRSQKNILEAANNVIKNNKNRQSKQLVSTIDEKEKIYFYKAYNETAEAGFIAEQINKLRRSGLKYNDICILYRKNSQSRMIEKVLSSQSIPFIIYGGFRFFDRSEVKSVMAYLRLVYNKEDNIAFTRVYNFPARGIGTSSFEKLQKISNDKKISLYKSIDYLDNKTQDKFLEFKELIDKMEEKVKFILQKSLSKAIIQIIIDSGLEELFKKDNKEGPQKLDNIYELSSAAQIFQKENSNLTNDKLIEEFFTLSSLESDVKTNKKNEDNDCVKLMTVHTSKGLEWNTVFICGLEEGLMPHISNIENIDNLEEERRLFYVAITRAKEKLYITRAEERMMMGQTNLTQSSRFLYEIPKNLFQPIY